MVAPPNIEVRDTLIFEKDRYVVPSEDGTFSYYPFKPGELRNGNNYLELAVGPQVCKEGFASYKGSLYKVPLRDLFRSQVRVNLSSATRSNDVNVAPNKSAKAATVGSPNGGELQQEVARAARILEDETIDMAWEDQARALLYVSDPQEEWDFQEVAQSRPSNETGTVSPTD